MHCAVCGGLFPDFDTVRLGLTGSHVCRTCVRTLVAAFARRKSAITEAPEPPPERAA